MKGKVDEVIETNYNKMTIEEIEKIYRNTNTIFLIKNGLIIGAESENDKGDN